MPPIDPAKPNAEPHRRWRTGTKVPFTLYDGDRFVGSTRMAGDAALIAAGMNATTPAPQAHAGYTAEDVAKLVKAADEYLDATLTAHGINDHSERRELAEALRSFTTADDAADRGGEG